MIGRTTKLGLSAGIAAVALISILGSHRGPAEIAGELAEVRSGELVVRSIYQGKVEARNQVTVTSRFRGFATVVELVREGAEVRAGDLLARFDSAELEREILKLEEEYALAETEYESLVNAVIPLELSELEMELQKFSEAVAAEKQYLADSIALASENIVSNLEIEQQRAKVAQLEAERGGIAERLQLNRDYLHPSKLQRAGAQLHAARQALELARSQLEKTTVYAPAGGLLVYKPLHIGGEYRTLRVGDSLHANQPFMVIPDLNDLVLRCMIPESEISGVRPGQAVWMVPQAFADVRLEGVVEVVGAIAESVPGQPDWQKYFSATIAIDNADARLRPGMSATAHIVSRHSEDTLLVPRRAVSWSDGRPYVDVTESLQITSRAVALGAANETDYEVLEGLSAGDRVVLR